jgi:hypothetical protein
MFNKPLKNTFAASMSNSNFDFEVKKEKIFMLPMNIV